MVTKFDYTLGLDIGTNSVGWAVYDNDSNDVPAFRGRSAFGTVTFDSAETAEATRLKRNARRGYRRRVRRIQLLQELFTPIINDIEFFRITEQKHPWTSTNNFENRTLSEVLLEVGYTKEEVNRRYPTIYHLRKDLLNSDKEFDLRLVYLTIHNLVKYRGHFLLKGVDWKERDVENSSESFKKLFKAMDIASDIEPTEHDNIDINKITSILGDSHKTRNDRNKNLKTELPKNQEGLGNLLLGMNIKLSTLFKKAQNVEELKASNLSINFSQDDEENEEQVYNILTDEQAEVIDNARELYTDLLLQAIIGNHNNIAEAKVEEYEQFKKELKQLKDKVYQNYGLQAGHALFKSTKESLNNFKENPNSSNLKKLCYFDQLRLDRKSNSTTRKGFVTALNKIDKNKIFEKESNLIEDNLFLKFLNTTDNAVIPNQNNVFEAVRILENQQKYHSSISDELIDKVKQLISFRIPYYIGPLIKDNNQSRFAWMTRERDERVTPFNFDEIVDKSNSANDFIKRMIGKCTFILEEDVLSKHSLLYQKMNVINELANIRIIEKGIEGNTNFITLEASELQQVIDQLFKKQKVIKEKRLKDFLVKALGYDESIKIVGLSNKDEFNSTLSSYVDFSNIIGSENLNNRHKEVEYIIEWLTIFNEKEIIKKKIEDNFSHWLTHEQIEKITLLNYSGWGNISKRLLELTSGGETLLEVMETSPCNMMSAINNKGYNFKAQIEEINKESIQTEGKERITYNDIKELKGSPALKKGIWVTIRVIEEIVKIFGAPKNIVLEFARGDETKRQTKAWEKQWEKTVKDNKLQKDKDFEAIYKEFEDYKDELNFKEEKIRLYLLQGGKCLYTKESIDLNALLNPGKENNLYEVDHILPRSFVKDDSLDNKALVLSKVNSRKSDTSTPLQVISNNKKHEIKAYWKFLYENNQMSQVKYFRLLKEEFTDTDKEKFTARQLVETRQILVHVKNLLEERFKDKVNIIPMSYQMTDEMRKAMNLPKIRELNDYHHAVDALLVAMAYQFADDMTKDGEKNIFHFDMRREKAKQKWKRVRKLIEGDQYSNKSDKKELFIVREMKKREIGNGKTLQEIIERIIDGKEPIVTRVTGSKSSAFYDETVYSPKEIRGDKKDKIVVDEKFHFKGLKSHGAFVYKAKGFKKSNENKKEWNCGVDSIRVIDRYSVNVYDKNQFEKYLLDNKRIDTKTLVVEDINVALIIEENTKVIHNNEPYYIISGNELQNSKQLKLTLDEERELYLQLNSKEDYDVNKSSSIYENLFKKIYVDYNYLFGKAGEKSTEEKYNHFLQAFNESKKTQKDFKECVTDILKISSADGKRSKFKGVGRVGNINNKEFIKNGKIIYESITGLYYKNPKYIHKFLE